MDPREKNRARRHFRLRKKISGTTDHPRLAVHRSSLHLYAQLIDDVAGKTLLACSTRHEEFQKAKTKGGTVEGAKRLGELVAKTAKAAGIKKVVFDRGGYPYHGRVKALAEAARAQGLEF